MCPPGHRCALLPRAAGNVGGVPRIMLRGRVDEDTARAWDRWLTEERLTFAAVLEAIGREIAAGKPPTKRVAELAAKIDRERNSKR